LNDAFVDFTTILLICYTDFVPDEENQYIMGYAMIALISA
jgi:hypothetical protein